MIKPRTTIDKFMLGIVIAFAFAFVIAAVIVLTLGK
jgi:hypothetical protein